MTHIIEFNIDAYLDSLPEDTDKIRISNKNLTYIPDSIIRFKNLKRLLCYMNKLQKLPKLLPPSLVEIHCFDNQIEELPDLDNLPLLNYLNCSNNKIRKIGNLPRTLTRLRCNKNRLTELPALPECLVKLCCEYNHIEKLPKLPNTLKHLDCSHNSELVDLPRLPETMEYLNYTGTRSPFCNMNLENLLKLQRFKTFYYTQKYKSKFLKWKKNNDFMMWEKIDKNDCICISKVKLPNSMKCRIYSFSQL